MADDVFALSPISARPAQPSEADYEAIRDAFMETSRGRWFLGEYAKRNRNADTTMVLDAVARIEETLAAQKPQPAPDRTPEVLQAIRRAVEAAEAAVGAALDRTTLDNGVAPIHRGIRIIKEISWRWREIGADGRICDLIDSQLTMIEGACEQITASDPRTELKAVFDLLRRAVEDSAAADGAESPPRAGSPATGMAAEPERAAAEDASAASEAGAILSESASLAEPAAVISETPSPAGEGAQSPRDPAAVLSTHNSELESLEPADEAETALDGEQTSLDATAEAEDDAVLDLIALEMGALDEPDDFLDPVTKELANVPEGKAIANAVDAIKKTMAATTGTGLFQWTNPQSPSGHTRRLRPPSSTASSRSTSDFMQCGQYR